MGVVRGPASLLCGWLVLIGAQIVTAATVTPVPWIRGNTSQALGGRRLLVRNAASNFDARLLAFSLLNLNALDLITNENDKLPKLTAPKPVLDVSATGIVQFKLPDEHLMSTIQPKGAVVLTTGTVFRAVDLSYASSEYPERDVSVPDIVNSNIPNSHDAVVLDFWVQTRRAGLLEVDAVFTTNECHASARALHTDPAALALAEKPGDTFHFEVDGQRLEKFSDKSTVSVHTLLRTKDAQLNPPNMAYCAWARVAQRPKPVTKGQKLRIKFRIADVGDRRIDSAVWLQRRSLNVRGV